MTRIVSELAYVPVLHRELLPGSLPESLQDTLMTVWPGLPRPRTGFQETHWLIPDFLYTPAQAAACLADLRQLDEESLALAVEPDRSGGFSHEERQAVATFAKTGITPDAPVRNRTAERQWAQRFLLLGWIQEERVLEMDALAERYRAGARRLLSQLGEEMPDDATSSEPLAGLIPAMHELFPEDPTTLLPSWRFMLELLAAILPEETILCSADPRMCTAILEAGLCQDSPPETLMATLPAVWHEKDTQSRLRWHHTSVRHILGIPAHPDKPWLDTERTFLLYVSEK